MTTLRRTGLAVLMAGLLFGSVGYGTSWAGTSDSEGDNADGHSKSHDGDDDGHHRDRDSIKGDGESFGKFAFHAEKTGDSPFKTKGYFQSEGPGPLNAVFALNGPITCLEVDGNRAGFLYTITDDSKPFLVKHLEVLVSVEDGDHDRISFGVGVPVGTYHGCAPAATMNDLTSGYIKVHDAKD